MTMRKCEINKWINNFILGHRIPSGKRNWRRGRRRQRPLDETVVKLNLVDLMMGRFVFAAGITRKLNGNQLYTAQWKKNSYDVMREHSNFTRNFKRFNR
jgi:hypothetical protein